MVASWLAALWLGLIAPAGLPGGGVVVAPLEVLDEPDDSAYASGELVQGDRVIVIPGAGPGWLAIKPPDGAFDWIEAASIRDEGDGRALVVADRAKLRTGADQARMPGPPRPDLPRGAALRLLDRPALTVGSGAKARTWRAIAPLADEVRYVRLEGIRLDPRPASAVADPKVQAARGERGGDARPIDDPSARFEEALRRSRMLDHEVAEARQVLAVARTSVERGYDASGRLQASSRKVDGLKVHALIGPEGVAIAYLKIPLGVPAASLLNRKVGVRGEVHFDESLGNRLITVRDLDPLDRKR